MVSPALGLLLLRTSVPGSSRLLTSTTRRVSPDAPWASVAVRVATCLGSDSWSSSLVVVMAPSWPTARASVPVSE